MNKKIAVLCGGESSEREISLTSGKAVLKALIELGYEAISFDPKFEPLSKLVDLKITKVFNVLHGGAGENGIIQASLANLGIKFTGSGVLASALAMDKYRTKLIWQALDLPTAKMLFFTKEDEINPKQIIENLGLPLFVKASCEGSSFGVYKVFDANTLENAINQALQFGQGVVVEQFVDGSEYSIPVLGEKILPAIQIIPDGEFYDYKAKYQSNKTQYLIAEFTKEKEKELHSLVEKASKGLGLQGWFRVDFMLDKSGHFQLMEVNTTPGMTPTSLVPKSAKHLGIDFNELVAQILEQVQ